LAKIEAPTGTLISFACAPGTVASDGEPGHNGVFTEQLLQHLPRAEDIEHVLGYIVSGVQRATNGAQVPWKAGGLARDPKRNGGDIYLIEPAMQSPAPAPAAALALLPIDAQLAAFLDSCSLNEVQKTQVATALEGIGVTSAAHLDVCEEEDLQDLKLPPITVRVLKAGLKMRKEKTQPVPPPPPLPSSTLPVVQAPLSDKAQEFLKQMEGKTELNLNCTKMGGAEASALAEALKVNKTLTRLEIDNNGIGDAGASALAEALKVNKTLMALSIICNNIGDASKQALKSSARNGCTVYG